MPYYPQEGPGLLGQLANAAAAYMGTKMQMQDAELERQRMQQQMALAPQLAAAQLSEAQARSDEAKAEAARYNMESQPFGGYPKGMQSAPGEPTMPTPSLTESYQAQADQIHKFIAGFQGAQTFYQKRLEYLGSQPQTPAIKDEITANQDALKEIDGQISAGQREMDQIRGSVQTSSEAKAAREDEIRLMRSIPQAKISISTGGRGSKDVPDDAQIAAGVKYINAFQTNPATRHLDPSIAANRYASYLESQGASQKTIDAVRYAGAAAQGKYAEAHPTTYMGQQSLQRAASGGGLPGLLNLQPVTNP